MSEQQYEYKTVGWESEGFSFEDPEERINAEAVDGWELFETIEINGSTTSFVFRREK